MADPADTQRLIGDLARLGVVQSVDGSAGTARVAIGDLVVDMPWLASRSGDTRHWSPPTAGEQVLVICPEGDTAGAMIVGSLSCDAHPAPADDGSTVLTFGDGARLSYDPGAHALVAELPAGATARVVAPGGLTIEADVEIKGGLTITGQVYAQQAIHSDEDVSAHTVSLQHHVHDKTQPGGGTSGMPVA